jgi:hypothetical protein
MFSLIKFTIAFCLSFVLLSIPVQKKPLFYYLNDWAAPITGEIFDHSKSVLIKGVKDGKTFGKKIFNNAKPDLDQISIQSSSVDRAKKSALETLDKDFHSDYTDEEKSMLTKILKSNQ